MALGDSFAYIVIRPGEPIPRVRLRLGVNWVYVSVWVKDGDGLRPLPLVTLVVTLD